MVTVSWAGRPSGGVGRDRPGARRLGRGVGVGASTRVRRRDRAGGAAGWSASAVVGVGAGASWSAATSWSPRRRARAAAVGGREVAVDALATPTPATIARPATSPATGQHELAAQHLGVQRVRFARRAAEQLDDARLDVRRRRGRARSTARRGRRRAARSAHRAATGAAAATSSTYLPSTSSSSSGRASRLVADDDAAVVDLDRRTRRELRGEVLAVALGELGDEVRRHRRVAALVAAQVAGVVPTRLATSRRVQPALLAGAAQQRAEAGRREVVEQERDDARRGFVEMGHTGPHRQARAGPAQGSTPSARERSGCRPAPRPGAGSRVGVVERPRISASNRMVARRVGS